MHSSVTRIPLGSLGHQLLSGDPAGGLLESGAPHTPPPPLTLQTVRERLEVRQEIPTKGRGGDNLRDLARGWAFSQLTIGVPGVERRGLGSHKTPLIWTVRAEEEEGQTELGKSILVLLIDAPHSGREALRGLPKLNVRN